MSRRGRLVAPLLAALILAAPSTAQAQAVSRAELTALAQRAANDPAAREELLARGVGADASRFETSPERPISPPLSQESGGFRPPEEPATSS